MPIKGKKNTDDTNVFENHEVIDEKDSLALEQFPDSFQSLPFVLSQHRHAVGARHEVHPVNVLRTSRMSWAELTTPKRGVSRHHANGRPLSINHYYTASYSIK